MRLLLDTHIALWAVTDDPRLSQEARSFLLDERSDLYVSSASVWEIAIKHRLARGDMPVSSERASALFRASGYRELPVSDRHAVATEALLGDHSDPFDRLLLAQASTEPMILVTRDRKLAGFSSLVRIV